MAAVELDKKLYDFNLDVRQKTVKDLAEQVKIGQIIPEKDTPAFNLHCHTFFSFNAYGYSPSGLAWLSRLKGYKALGIVDFDTLDGVDEFFDACDILGVRGSAGIETRVFVPEFSTREINSPGEPGVLYHMGIGFTSSSVPEAAAGVIDELRQRSNQRNRDMVQRINPFLSPVSVDYDRDVLPLTPAGNATERHLLTAYIKAAEKQVPDVVSFWAKVLGQSSAQIQAVINDPAKISNLIRAKLMKRGGVGYVQPGSSTFPTVEEFHALITACGALPCFAWLDGMSTGEKDIRELLELMVSKGAVAVNIIPDRNWNIADAEQRSIKVQNLYNFVKLAQEMDLPINVGTEMNSPGNKLVDDFDVPELAQLYPAFWDGACFVYGHTVLQRSKSLGYHSVWAQQHFASRRERNAFYTQVGKLIPPGKTGVEFFKQLDHNYSPEAIINGLINIK